MTDDKKPSSAQSVGESILADNAAWTFGGEVAENFSDHVQRSVPLYDRGHDLVCRISDFFLKDGSLCYELGASTGVLTQKLAAHNTHHDVRFVGIDREEEMLREARKTLADYSNVELVADDINFFEFEPTDMIVSYYTIQFVPPRQRQDLINKIYNALKWGGAFVLFEKVRASDARFQDICTALYTDYKLEQGFTPEEILAKSRSLKGVLEPFSTQGNIDMLKRAGFVDILSIMKYVCFEGFLVIK